MRISDWSSDVCSSDLGQFTVPAEAAGLAAVAGVHVGAQHDGPVADVQVAQLRHVLGRLPVLHLRVPQPGADEHRRVGLRAQVVVRSEEHTSELQSLMRISYAVFCLKKKNS